jgi:hypothetical protein
MKLFLHSLSLGGSVAGLGQCRGSALANWLLVLMLHAAGHCWAERLLF